MGEFDALSDRALMEVMATDVRRVRHAIYGNGRPGLLERTAVLESQHEMLEERIPSKRDKTALVASAIAAFLVAAASALKNVV